MILILTLTSAGRRGVDQVLKLTPAVLKQYTIFLH